MIVNMNQKNGSYSIMCEQIAIESRNAVLAELACHYLNGVRERRHFIKDSGKLLHRRLPKLS